MIRWLTDHKLWDDVVGDTVLFIFTVVIVGTARKVMKKARGILHVVRLIADRLDTTTPGGLGDLVADEDAHESENVE